MKTTQIIEPGKRPEPWLDYDLTDRESEEWRDVTGYDSLYQVSSHGRVKSLARQDRIGRHVRERIRHQTINSVPARIRLCQDRVDELVTVMQLVAKEFLPEKSASQMWMHGNENQLDNRVNNIVVGTRTERNTLNYQAGQDKQRPTLNQLATAHRQLYYQSAGTFEDGELVALRCLCCEETLKIEDFRSLNGSKKNHHKVCRACRNRKTRVNRKNTKLVQQQSVPNAAF